MVRIFAVLLILMSTPAFADAQTAQSTVTLTWLGQATFVMDTNTGLKVLMDPTDPSVYKPAPVDDVDVITVSHEHVDHNFIQMATGSPLIIRGLTQFGFDSIDHAVKGVRIWTVPAYHDIEKGAKRGRNALFVFEMPGLRIVHLGDLCHKLDPAHVSAIGPVDILMTPVDGGNRLDAKTAVEVINQLQAKVVIPMHYPTAALAAAGRKATTAGVDEFLKVLDPSIKVEQAGHRITLESGKLPAQRTIMVMKYE